MGAARARRCLRPAVGLGLSVCAPAIELQYILAASYHRQMAMNTTAPQDDETAAMKAAACLFHGLSNPSRVAILRHLRLGEHRVVDLTAHLGLPQSTVSKHLACLRDCGLVTSRPEGRATVWTLNHAETVVSLLASAERLLALTGDAVTLCPTYGTESLGSNR